MPEDRPPTPAGAARFRFIPRGTALYTDEAGDGRFVWRGTTR